MSELFDEKNGEFLHDSPAWENYTVREKMLIWMLYQTLGRLGVVPYNYDGYYMRTPVEDGKWANLSFTEIIEYEPRG